MGNDLKKFLKNPDSRNALKKLLNSHEPLLAEGEGITCTLCNNEAWWPENGFSEAERQALCGPQGIGCPGFGEGD